MSTALTLSTFTAPARPLKIPLPVDAPEGGWTWPPTSVTLIAGEHDAVLVDTVPTIEDSKRLADWIERTGKRLTAIYITHGHIDHYFGTATLLERFPDAKVVSTEATARFIAEEKATGRDRATYAAFFIDEIGSKVIVPEPLADHRIDLEGHELIAVPAGQSDLSESSYLWVPELAAAIVGDIAYNDVHPILADSDHGIRQAWIQTLNEIQSRKPEIVIAAHRREDAIDDASPLADTIAYVELADRLLADGPSAAQFIARMVEANPTRANGTTVVFGAAMLGLQ
ncbi:MBL fold metallo-hydrolase [Streptomyces sp. NPDC058678]|uniref:MBL fold metallo-hydrolase n=1 Tax=Streptomyces sp. NPDC058678 TaxID=3346595 RepID=UPI0036687110